MTGFSSFTDQADRVWKRRQIGEDIFCIMIKFRMIIHHSLLFCFLSGECHLLLGLSYCSTCFGSVLHLVYSIHCSSFQQLCVLETLGVLMQSPSFLRGQKVEMVQLLAILMCLELGSSSVETDAKKKTFSSKQMRPVTTMGNTGFNIGDYDQGKM